MFDVNGSRQLRAAALAMKAADRDLKKQINIATREEMNPLWKSLVELNATYAMDARVLAKGARIAAGNPPSAVAASSTRALSGGLVPADRWAVFEFGTSNPNKVLAYQTTSRKGKKYTVRRHTSRQLPRRDQSGRAVHPAFAEMAPRMVSLWVQLIVRKYRDASEKGS